MRTRLSIMLGLAALMSLVYAAGAIAQGNPPFTDRTRAEFQLEAVNERTKTCEGQDGQYLDFVIKYEGQAEGDPRLSGNLDLTAQALVRTNPDDGPFLPDTGAAGQAEGTYHIRGDDSRANGRFFATVGGTFPGDVNNNLEIEGIAVGPVKGTERQSNETDNDFEGGELIGNFRAASTDPEGRNVNGTLGGTGVPPVGAGEPDTLESPAFIQAGNCRGPAENN